VMDQVRVPVTGSVAAAAERVPECVFVRCRV
jgi:hypothetical protein